MNLAFNFKDKLFWIHNFLPENLYKDMYIDFIKKRKILGFKKSIVNWNRFEEEIGDMSVSFNQKQTYKLDYFNKYHTFLKHQPFVNFLDYKFVSHLRQYKYGQHLVWHSDTLYPSDIEKGSDNTNYKRRYAATFYFNKTWGESWGGELMFKSNEGSGFIPIVGNSLVIVKTGLTHKVNSNLKKTHPRMSIQTWVDEIDKT